MTSKVEFYYIQADFLKHVQDQNMVALNAADQTVSSYKSYYTPVNVVYDCDGVIGKGHFNAFRMVRDNLPNSDVMNLGTRLFTCDSGKVAWGFDLTTTLLQPGTIYESFAIYREGLFARTQFPRVTVEVLPDADLTRKFTIYY